MSKEQDKERQAALDYALQIRRLNPDRSTPSLSAVFEDWPSGFSGRCRCTFAVEHTPKKGYRFVRTTTGKPKTATYGGKAAIVDGDNGKTYLIQFAGVYDFITINRSDFKNASKDEIGGEAAVFPDDPRYPTLKSLIQQANPA